MQMGSNGCINNGGEAMEIGFGLSLGLGQAHGDQNYSSGSKGFTFLQLQELEHQTLIYKYMEAGLQVPSHLISPILKSVISSLSGLRGKMLPASYSNLLNHSYSNDPEPRRCRRTDGKKWRCSRDVVPERKYCERHMHRGRQRSRKPVEAWRLPNYVTTTFTTTMDSDTTLTISLPSTSSTSNGIGLL